MRVVVAVIFDDKDRVLITRRPLHTTHGGMWEFPGGKIEKNESPEFALIREIKEEVGLHILEFSFLDEISHTYDSRTVNLLIYKVTKFIGVAACCEAQLDLGWVKIAELNNYDFPKANDSIIEKIVASQIMLC